MAPAALVCTPNKSHDTRGGLARRCTTGRSGDLAMAEFLRFERNGVVGFLHEPTVQSHCAMVLTHGAGGNCSAPLLIATANAFCAAGVLVLRYDLPFRQRRASGPPSRAMASEDRSGLKAAADELRERGSRRIYLAGHSYGGRQASMLLAEEPNIAMVLLLLSYPLHPPKKPREWRTQHFASLRTKTVFVHGDADPFGSLEELRSALLLISAPTELIAINGAGHDLKRGQLDFVSIVSAVLDP
jgi:uncharacterized protein